MTRPFIAAILLLTFPASALAGTESDTLARLEQMERDIASLKASLARPVQPAPRISPRYASAAKALLAYRYAAFGSPLLPAVISGGGGFTGGTVADATTFTSDVTFNGGTGALGFASGETLVPADAVLNVTGGVTASATVTASNLVVNADIDIENTSGAMRFKTAAGVQVDDGTNVLFSITDDGATGSIRATSTKNSGTITLSAGTGTATVRSGAVCVCTDTTANASVQCAVATTTLTATGTASDVVAYWCN